MAFNRKVIPALCLLIGGPAWGGSQSPWLPAPHELDIAPTYYFTTANNAWKGVKFGPIAPNNSNDSVTWKTVTIDSEYGLTDKLALDVTLGYTRVKYASRLTADTSGMTDFLMGVRYRAVNEFYAESKYTPTVTLRAGGVIAGTYDPRPNAGTGGDRPNGMETDILMGKVFGESGFGLYGSFGYRVLLPPVPDAYIGSLGFYQTIFKRVTGGFSYHRYASVTGKDFGDAGFQTHFRELKQIMNLYQADLGITDNGGRYYGVFVSKVLKGNNFPEWQTIGFTMNFPFQIGKR